MIVKVKKDGKIYSLDFSKDIRAHSHFPEINQTWTHVHGQFVVHEGFLIGVQKGY